MVTRKVDDKKTDMEDGKMRRMEEFSAQEEVKAGKKTKKGCVLEDCTVPRIG